MRIVSARAPPESDTAISNPNTTAPAFFSSGSERRFATSAKCLVLSEFMSFSRGGTRTVTTGPVSPNEVLTLRHLLDPPLCHDVIRIENRRSVARAGKEALDAGDHVLLE